MKKDAGVKRKSGTDKNPAKYPVKKGKTTKGSKVNG
jgi:hypothetical protein